MWQAGGRAGRAATFLLRDCPPADTVAVRGARVFLIVAACSACHSPTGAGNNGAGYPALSGQDPGYTETQLRAFRDGSRNNDIAEVMQDIVARLNDAEIQALASYVSGLRAE